MPKLTFLPLLIFISSCLSDSQLIQAQRLPTLDLPYAEAGLSEAQAAAHLLDRLAYGARPGEVDQLVAQGIEDWVIGQLYPDQEPELNHALNAQFPALAMPIEEIGQTYPAPGVRLIFASMQLGEDNNEGRLASNSRRPFRGNRSQLRANRNRMRQSATPRRNRMGRDSMNAPGGNRQSDLKTPHSQRRTSTDGPRWPHGESSSNERTLGMASTGGFNLPAHGSKTK